MSGIAAQTNAACLTVAVEVQNYVGEVDNLAVGLAFLFGFIIGLVITIFILKKCLKDFSLRKQHREDEEEHLVYNRNIVEYGQHENPAFKSDKVEDKKPAARKRAKTAKSRPRTGKSKAEEPLVDIQIVSLATTKTIDGSNSTDPADVPRYRKKGLVDALVQTNGASVTSELMDQDMDATDDLARELREENIMTAVQLVRIMLNKHLANGKLSEDQHKDIVNAFQTDINTGIQLLQTERDEEENELKNDKVLKTLPDELDKKLDSLNAKYDNKLNSTLREQKEKLRIYVKKNSDLSALEIDQLMANLNDNLAKLNKKHNTERARQQAALEERLAKRRLLAEKRQFDLENESNDLEARSEALKDTVGDLVKDGKIMERQKDEIINQYRTDMQRITLQQQEENEKQKLKLADELRRRREARLNKQQEQHEAEKEMFLGSLDKETNTSNFVESYHKLAQKHRVEADNLIEDLDADEHEKMTSLIKRMEQETMTDLDRQEEQSVGETVKAKAQLSEREMARLIDVHHARLEDYERQKIDSRRKHKMQLEEKLAQRKQKAEEEKIRALAEQKVLREQEDSTIDKVLQSQHDLSKEAKEKILKEYENNMVAVNNQLEMSRMRQQKQFEQKLAARRAKVENMKQKQQALQSSGKEMKQKEKDKLLKELEQQIKEAETSVADMHASRVAELHHHMAQETAAALAEQEKELGDSIARLQVDQARRLALIEQQDETLKELEAKVADKVGDVNDNQSDRKVNQIMMQHQNQVGYINDKMQDEKDRQELILKEKLEAKKLRKERELENKIDSEAQESWNEQRKRGAGKASALLGQLMLEQKHKLAMQELEHEMEREMQQQREQIDREMEQDLQNELAEQKKSFLAQLAAIGNVTKAEMNEIVQDSVADAGGNQKEARKLAKEMRQELHRAKSDLHEQYQGRDAYERSRFKNNISRQSQIEETDYYGDDNYYR